MLKRTLLAFLSFSFLSSAVYVINDIKDVEKDRQHSTKCKRPIASGAINVRSAVVLAAVLLTAAGASNYFAAGTSVYAWFIPLAYLLLNLGYSFGLKSIPVLDICILASGFFLRLLYGSSVTMIVLSKWLYLTVVAASFYMGLGKRRNEIKREDSDTRKVLKLYVSSFLDKNMYMYLGIAIVFYSLWCVDLNTIERIGSDKLIWTVPVVIAICLKYSLNIEGDSDGDPIEVIFRDKILMLLCLAYALILFGLLYF